MTRVSTNTTSSRPHRHDTRVTRCSDGARSCKHGCTDDTFSVNPKCRPTPSPLFACLTPLRRFAFGFRPRAHATRRATPRHPARSSPHPLASCLYTRHRNSYPVHPPRAQGDSGTRFRTADSVTHFSLFTSDPSRCTRCLSSFPHACYAVSSHVSDDEWVIRRPCTIFAPLTSRRV
jgi:hypothetical protein